MDALGVLVELGTAVRRPTVPDLWHFHDQLLGDEAHAGGLASEIRIEDEVDGEGAFVEGRQERARKR
jgi:hypothetical protein